MYWQTVWLHASHKNYELLMNTRNSPFDRVVYKVVHAFPLQYVEFTLANAQDTRLLMLMDSRCTVWESANVPFCHSISQQWAVLSVCGPERFPTLTFLQTQANGLHVYCNVWFCRHCAERNRACAFLCQNVVFLPQQYLLNLCFLWITWISLHSAWQQWGEKKILYFTFFFFFF